MIRPLTPSDAPADIALRREMLSDSPRAFPSSPEDDAAPEPGIIIARMTRPARHIKPRSGMLPVLSGPPAWRATCPAPSLDS
jgi:hypothetical protein